MNDAEAYEFDLNGFVTVHKLLDESQVARINAILDAQPNITDEFSGKFSFFHLDPVFADIMAEPRLLKRLEPILGDQLRLDHVFGLQMFQGDNYRQSLHGGHVSPQGGVAWYQVANRRISNGLLKVSIALTAVDNGDGGMVCVPGSHKANFEFAPPLNSHLVVNPPLAAGDALVFTEALVHGTRPWLAASPRRCLIYSYAPGFLAWQEPAVMAQYAVSATTDEQRNLLRPPFVGYYEDLPPALWENPRHRTPVIPRPAPTRAEWARARIKYVIRGVRSRVRRLLGD